MTYPPVAVNATNGHYTITFYGHNDWYTTSTISYGNTRLEVHVLPTADEREWIRRMAKLEAEIAKATARLKASSYAGELGALSPHRTLRKTKLGAVGSVRRPTASPQLKARTPTTMPKTVLPRRLCVTSDR